MIRSMETMNVDEFKSLTCILVLTLGLIGGFLPLQLMKTNSKSCNSKSCTSNTENVLVATRTRKGTVSFLNMFTAGVFLGSALLHILPDAAGNKQIANFMDEKFFSANNTMSSYPWAYLFFSMGFVLLLSLELIAHELQGNVTTSFRNNDNKDKFKSSKITPVRMEEELQLLTHTKSTPQSQQPQPIAIVYEDCCNCCCCLESVNGDQDELMNVNVNIVTDKNHDSLVMSFVVFISLSFHSIMAGIGIGSQMGCAWGIFFAILAHKSLVAFSLGVELISQSVQGQLYVILILLFSLSTPSGILVGWGLTIFSADDSPLSGICMAISGGTFLYISVIEIIPGELRCRNNTRLKIGALSFGIAIIAILKEYL